MDPGPWADHLNPWANESNPLAADCARLMAFLPDAAARPESGDGPAEEGLATEPAEEERAEDDEVVKAPGAWAKPIGLGAPAIRATGPGMQRNVKRIVTTTSPRGTREDQGTASGCRPGQGG